jgi:hypothetical protein
MAEKHKSKYKKPENTKYKSRKDLKDYTVDDKDGKLNPYSTKEKQSNVLRKTDKTVQDDGTYDVKYNADDRLYKDLEDGEYDAKHAAKILKKRQDNEEKDFLDIKDKVENLTREQKERLVREYVRRTIVKQLIEQEDKDAEELDPNAAAPAPDLMATPSADPNAAAPAPDLMATPSADPNAAAPAPEAPPAAPTTPAETTDTPEAKAQEKIAKQKIALKYWEEMLSDQTGPNSLVDTGFDPLAKALGNLDVKDLKLAKIMILRRLAKIKPTRPNNDTTEK